MKNIDILSQKIAEAVKNILLEEFENTEVSDVISEHYQSFLDEEQTIFEEGVDVSDINQQTLAFLKNRDKK